LMEPGANIADLFDNVETRLVDLESGEYTDAVDADTFDMAEAANDPSLSEAIPAAEDIGNIRRRPLYAPVYLVRHGDELEQVILPVYGAGLWSTMYGYLALDSDGETIRGLQFYEQGETPGLGGEVDNPDWRSLWVGKKLYDDAGTARIEVVRGQVAASDPAGVHKIDGLSGATLTGRGVTNLIRFWTGPNGFGPYLANLRNDHE
jgi:Na+-transporting NADH:ubiquinone oxidoreductase subunit C